MEGKRSWGRYRRAERSEGEKPECREWGGFLEKKEGESVEKEEGRGKGEREVFGRSKKTPRSPGKVGGGKEEEKEWREELGGCKSDMEVVMREIMMAGIKELKGKIGQMKEKVKGSVEELRREMREKKRR
jgi:hypothetical protein